MRSIFYGPERDGKPRTAAGIRHQSSRAGRRSRPAAKVERELDCVESYPGPAYCSVCAGLIDQLPNSRIRLCPAKHKNIRSFVVETVVNRFTQKIFFRQVPCKAAAQ